MYNIRVGIGYDVHQLAEELDLWIGGVKIPHTHGALGHSDADVLIHAVCDALLGAAGLRDIGYHFADTDSQWKDIDSKILLKKVVLMLHEHGYAIGNVDTVLILQAPKIAPYVTQMQQALAHVMGIEENCVSIKATTAEKMGFVGRKEGLEAKAVALIFKV